MILLSCITHLADHLIELIDSQGLIDTCHSSSFTHRSERAHVVGQPNDTRVRQKVLYLLGGRYTIELGHVDIHDDEIGAVLQGTIDRLLTVDERAGSRADARFISNCLYCQIMDSLNL